MTVDPEHTIDVERRIDGEYEVTCRCGQRWTHKASETAEQMKSIYESHLRYFNKPKMETL